MTGFVHTGRNGGLIEVSVGYGHSPTRDNVHAQRMDMMMLGFNDGSSRTLTLNANGSISMTDSKTREAMPPDRRVLEEASRVFRNPQFVAGQFQKQPHAIPSTFSTFDTAISNALRTLNPAAKAAP